MSGPTRVAVVGATGRMGRELLGAAASRDDIALPVAASRSPEDGPIAGYDLDDEGALQPLLADRAVDVLVDFTVPEASVDYVTAAAEVGVGSVVGTTGFDEPQQQRLTELSEDVPVLQASNFAPGVQTLAALVADAAGALSDYDIEVVEAHHNGKRDAPSGTAATLLDEIERAREIGAEQEVTDDGSQRVHGREGVAPRSTGEIGVHSIRAGTIAGEHEVILAGNDEVLSLGHRAGDRSVFAQGALDAAAWLEGQPPGEYEYRNVLGL